MTRKDTILAAVVINAGLLALLFAAAVIYDTEKMPQENPKSNESVKPTPALVASSTEVKESELNYYTPGQDSIRQEMQEENEFLAGIHPYRSKQESDDEEDRLLSVTKENPTEVIVKKGDALEKIASANGTTVKALKKTNQLENEKLRVGQVLKLPASKETSVAQASEPALNQQQEKAEPAPEPVYYVVKSGDSPWKIAKQMNVKYEDILRLNQLNEEKARNLKIGDRIRIK